jgi:hypothetical protein
MLYEDGRAAHQRRVVGQKMYEDSHSCDNAESGSEKMQLKVPIAAKFTQMDELAQNA